MADALIRAVITAKDEASAVVSGFGDSVSSTSQKAQQALAVAGAAAVGFGALSLKAFSDSQVEVAQLNQVLETTGKKAQISTSQVEDLAMSMERYSGQAHDAIEAGQVLLLQFSQVTSKNLPEFTKAMVDLAQRMGVDDVTAAKSLGIALDDPTTGMARLRRSGIDFTEAQKDAIKAMQATGNIAGADALLMQALQEKVGGAAGAYRGTFAGSVAAAKNSLKDFEIQVGDVISKALLPLLNELNKHPAILQTIIYLVLGLGAAFVVLKTAMLINTVITGVGTALQFVSGAAGVATGAIQALTVSTLAAAAPFVALGAAATAAFLLIQNAAKDTRKVLDDTASASSSDSDAEVAAYQRLGELKKSGTPAQQQAATKALAGIAGGGRASGGPISPGVPYLVGEQGPEIVVPNQNSTVIPNNKIGNMAQNINISVNVGTYAGSQMELRKLATKLHGALQDAQSMGTA